MSGPEFNPADDMEMTSEAWEEGATIECKGALEPLLDKYGSRILMKALACLFDDIKESASCYPYLAAIIDNLAEWEP